MVRRRTLRAARRGWNMKRILAACDRLGHWLHPWRGWFVGAFLAFFVLWLAFFVLFVLIRPALVVGSLGRKRV